MIAPFLQSSLFNLQSSVSLCPPEADGLVRSGAREPPPVGTETHGVDIVGMPGERLQERAVLDPPDPHVPAAAAGPLVSDDLLDQAADGRAVPAPACEVPAVGTEGDGIDALLRISRKCPHEPAVGRLPELYRLVVAAARDEPPVGTEGHRDDGLRVP